MSWPVGPDDTINLLSCGVSIGSLAALTGHLPWSVKYLNSGPQIAPYGTPVAQILASPLKLVTSSQVKGVSLCHSW
jgi:hypothetical protein